MLGGIDALTDFEYRRAHSLDEKTSDLIQEIQKELEDVCGWSCALWTRLEGLRDGAAKVDEDVQNPRRPDAESGESSGPEAPKNP